MAIIIGAILSLTCDKVIFFFPSSPDTVLDILKAGYVPLDIIWHCQVRGRVSATHTANPRMRSNPKENEGQSAHHSHGQGPRPIFQELGNELDVVTVESDQ